MGSAKRPISLAQCWLQRALKRGDSDLQWPGERNATWLWFNHWEPAPPPSPTCPTFSLQNQNTTSAAWVLDSESHPNELFSQTSVCHPSKGGHETSHLTAWHWGGPGRVILSKLNARLVRGHRDRAQSHARSNSMHEVCKGFSLPS